MLKGMRSVAALDGEVEVLGEHADAGPALGLHLVDVFHAGQGGNHVGSSSLGSLLANGVGSSEVVNAGDLQFLSASARVVPAAQGHYHQQGEEQEFHVDYLFIFNGN